MGAGECCLETHPHLCPPLEGEEVFVAQATRLQSLTMQAGRLRYNYIYFTPHPCPLPQGEREKPDKGQRFS